MSKADRNGLRTSRESRRTRVLDLGYYIIVTDTAATEANYLNGLLQSLPDEIRSRITLKVLQSRTDNLIGTCKSALSKVVQYGQPWIVFDCDRVIRFDKIIEKAEKERIHVGWSNPCIEVWFSVYFEKMMSYTDSVTCCRKFAETFLRKTNREYDKSDRNIYDLLVQYGNESKAIDVAEKRLQQYIKNEITSPSQMCPCTTLHRLIHEIRQKAKCINN